MKFNVFYFMVIFLLSIQLVSANSIDIKLDHEGFFDFDPLRQNVNSGQNFSYDLEITNNIPKSTFLKNVDVVFVLDASNSMGSELATVRATIRDVIDQMAQGCSDCLQVGLFIVEGKFKWNSIIGCSLEAENDFINKTASYCGKNFLGAIHLTTDVALVSDRLKCVDTTPAHEPWAYNIRDVLSDSNFGWRSDATKVIFAIADEPNNKCGNSDHEGKSCPGCVAARNALNANNAHFFGIYSGSDKVRNHMYNISDHLKLGLLKGVYKYDKTNTSSITSIVENALKQVVSDDIIDLSSTGLSATFSKNSLTIPRDGSKANLTVSGTIPRYTGVNTENLQIFAKVRNGAVSDRVSVNFSIPKINAVCGIFAKNYSASVNSWPSGNLFCLQGSGPAQNPLFPAAGRTVTWTCSGIDGGTDASCSAFRESTLRPTLSTSGSSIKLQIDNGGWVRYPDPPGLDIVGAPGTSFSKYLRIINDLGSVTTQQNLDLVIVLDASGSMGGELASVKSSIETIIDTINADCPGCMKVGIYILEGGNGGSSFITKSSYCKSDYDVGAIHLTANGATLTTALAPVGTGGGKEPWGDIIKNVLEDSAFGWRTGSDVVKAIIAIADEPGNDGCDSQGVVQTASDALNNYDAHFFGIYSGTASANMIQVASSVASPQIGSTFAYTDGNQVGPLILEAIQQILAEDQFSVSSSVRWTSLNPLTLRIARDGGTGSVILSGSMPAEGVYPVTINASLPGHSDNLRLRFISDITPPTCGSWTPNPSLWKQSGPETFTLSGSTDAGGSGINVAGGTCTTVATHGATCTVTISDNAGNTRNCPSPQNKVDSIPPNLPTISTTTTWTNAASVPVSITPGSDPSPSSGILKTEYRLTGATTRDWTSGTSFNIVNAGTTNIEARTIDNVGRISSIATASVSIDRILPTCGAWNPDPSPWKISGSQLFNLTCSDTGGSGCEVSMYSCTAAPSNGSTCTVNLRDNAGNTRTCTSPPNLVDDTPPILLASNASANWFKIPRTARITASDPASGLDQVRYNWGSNAMNTDCTSGGIDTFNGAILTAPAGGTTLYLCARDTVGNVATWNGIYRWENILPQVSASGRNTAWFTSPRFAVINVSDAGGSGLNRTRFSWNTPFDALCSAGSSTINGATLSAPSGDNILYLCAIDNAGNKNLWNGTYRWTGANASCVGPDGTAIIHGQGKTYWKESTVRFGQVCEKEDRFCINGDLTGSFTYTSCSVEDIPDPLCRVTPSLLTFTEMTYNLDECRVALRGNNLSFVPSFCGGLDPYLCTDCFEKDLLRINNSAFRFDAAGRKYCEVIVESNGVPASVLFGRDGDQFTPRSFAPARLIKSSYGDFFCDGADSPVLYSHYYAEVDFTADRFDVDGVLVPSNLVRIEGDIGLRSLTMECWDTPRDGSITHSVTFDRDFYRLSAPLNFTALVQSNITIEKTPAFYGNISLEINITGPNASKTDIAGCPIIQRTNNFVRAVCDLTLDPRTILDFPITIASNGTFTYRSQIRYTSISQSVSNTVSKELIVYADAGSELDIVSTEDVKFVTRAGVKEIRNLSYRDEVIGLQGTCGQPANSSEIIIRNHNTGESYMYYSNHRADDTFFFDLNNTQRGIFLGNPYPLVINSGLYSVELYCGGGGSCYNPLPAVLPTAFNEWTKLLLPGKSFLSLHNSNNIPDTVCDSVSLFRPIEIFSDIFAIEVATIVS